MGVERETLDKRGVGVESTTPDKKWGWAGVECTTPDERWGVGMRDGGVERMSKFKAETGEFACVGKSNDKCAELKLTCKVGIKYQNSIPDRDGAGHQSGI